MTLLIIVIVLTLFFDLINGFHDAANSIATVVSTKVLSPAAAVIWAAIFNYVAIHFFPLHVAQEVAKGIVHQDAVTLTVILAGILAAICWNLFTWWFGIPSSSSHTLIGGFAGAAIAKAGFSSIVIGGIAKISAFIVLAPLIGMIIALVLSVIITNICRRAVPSRVDKYFRRLQLVSSAAISLAHGANDAQKSMGIIYIALIAAQMISATAPIPEWVMYACQFAMAFGTMIGGWRIVKTMGQKITKLTPFEGFSAETAGAITLSLTSFLGIPVSTTHTTTGAIMGVGAIKRLSAVRWGVTINLLWAWVLTIPVSALLAAGLYALINLFVK
ncbi:inorganic phosphate transporter [Compostibacter hankyongensis]|uniref:Inorganic phosphate transporter n=1 Tax=Compostibacter hankyongensis TaxID=1007089 RepID=A0ABP8FF67_9BACT